ncbi:MAG: hypothetical protein SGILL_006273 [Bacillariaceae sp.]
MKFSSSIFLVTVFATTNAKEQKGLFSTLATSLLKSAASSAGGKLGETGAGFALAAIGMGGGQYTKQLDEIQTTLSSIDDNTKAILDEMKDWQCLKMMTELREAESIIHARVDTYNHFLRQASTTNVPLDFDCASIKAGDERVCVTTWASNVLDNSVVPSLMDRMYYIDSVLKGGLIEKCLEAHVEPPQQYEFDGPDGVNYWGNVYDFLQPYYNVQAQGVAMVVEAYHFRAWKAAGKPDYDLEQPETAMNEVCSSNEKRKYKPSPQTYCFAAYSATRDIRQHIVEQYEMVGAPYATNETTVQYLTSPEDPEPKARLYSQSPYGFNKAAGNDDCRAEDFQSDPYSYSTCGVSAVTGGNVQAIEQVKAYGMDSWSSATMDDIYSLGHGWKKDKAYGDYLTEIGFEDIQGKALLLNDTRRVRIGNNPCDPDNSVFEMNCYTDTRSKKDHYICNQAQVSPLVSGNPRSGLCEPDDFDSGRSATARGPSADTKLYDGFYNFEQNIVGPDEGKSLEMVTKPGYVKGNSKTNYVLPVVHLEDVECNAGNKKQNTQNVFIRCGDDRDQFFDLLIPQLPPYPQEWDVAARATMDEAGIDSETTSEYIVAITTDDEGGNNSSSDNMDILSDEQKMDILDTVNEQEIDNDEDQDKLDTHGDVSTIGDSQEDDEQLDNGEQEEGSSSENAMENEDELAASANPSRRRLRGSRV